MSVVRASADVDFDSDEIRSGAPVRSSRADDRELDDESASAPVTPPPTAKAAAPPHKAYRSTFFDLVPSSATGAAVGVVAARGAEAAPEARSTAIGASTSSTTSASLEPT